MLQTLSGSCCLFNWFSITFGEHSHLKTELLPIPFKLIYLSLIFDLLLKFIPNTYVPDLAHSLMEKERETEREISKQRNKT